MDQTIAIFPIYQNAIHFLPTLVQFKAFIKHWLYPSQKDYQTLHIHLEKDVKHWLYPSRNGYQLCLYPCRKAYQTMVISI